MASSLLSIPGEIRTRIYTFVLAADAPIVIKQPVYGRAAKDRNQKHAAAPRANRLALTYSCRRIHAETIGLWYSINTFVFISRRRSESFIRSLSPFNRANIVSVQCSATVLLSLIFQTFPRLKYLEVSTGLTDMDMVYLESFCEQAQSLEQIRLTRDSHTQDLFKKANLIQNKSSNEMMEFFRFKAEFEAKLNGILACKSSRK